MRPKNAAVVVVVVVVDGGVVVVTAAAVVVVVVVIVVVVYSRLFTQVVNNTTLRDHIINVSFQFVSVCLTYIFTYYIYNTT